MAVSPILLTTLLLLLGACHFDGSTSGYVEEGTPEPSEPSEPSQPGNDEEPTAVYFASQESTPEGDTVSGSFLDAASLDGASEVILAEVKRKEEKLHHKWLVQAVPAGTYEATMVAHPFSPIVGEYFRVDYKLSGSKTRYALFEMPASDRDRSFMATFELLEEADVEITIRLSEDAALLDSDLGLPGHGWREGDDDDDDDMPLRAIAVDYLALAQVVAQ